MLRQVDRCGDYIIQKVVSRRQKVIGYRIVRVGDYDTSQVRWFAKLGQARAVLRGTLMY